MKERALSEMRDAVSLVRSWEAEGPDKVGQELLDRYLTSTVEARLMIESLVAMSWELATLWGNLIGESAERILEIVALQMATFDADPSDTGGSE